MTWSTPSGSALSGEVYNTLTPHTGDKAMASGWAKVSKEGWNPYLQTKVCTVPSESRVFKGGENNPGDVGEVGVNVAAFQFLATWDFTCEIKPGLISL